MGNITLVELLTSMLIMPLPAKSCDKQSVNLNDVLLMLTVTSAVLQWHLHSCMNFYKILLVRAWLTTERSSTKVIFAILWRWVCCPYTWLKTGKFLSSIMYKLIKLSPGLSDAQLSHCPPRASCVSCASCASCVSYVSSSSFPSFSSSVLPHFQFQIPNMPHPPNFLTTEKVK